MDHDQRLAIHLELCERIFERMQREGSLPWKHEPDSTLGADMVESEDIKNDL
jgi:hypothetical protein